MNQLEIVMKEQEAKEHSPVVQVLRKIYQALKLRYRRQFFLILGIVMTVLVLQIWTMIPGWNDYKRVYYIGETTDVRFYWKPSLEHWLGTTKEGYDYFTRVLWATKNSIIFGLCTSAIATCLAIAVGVFGPFKGGKYDEATSFITRIVMVFPQIPLILFIDSLFVSHSWIMIMVIIAFFSWPWPGSSLRSQVLTIRERNFIKVSKISALRDMKIAFTEVIPNIFSYILLIFCMCFEAAIITEAALSILGFGFDSNEYISLGTLFLEMKDKSWVVFYYYHLWLTPGIILLVISIAFYYIHAIFLSTFNLKFQGIK